MNDAATMRMHLPERKWRWPRGTLMNVLPACSRTELLALGEPHQYRNGDILLREEEQSTHVVLIIRGFTKITASLENGKIAMLGIRVSGDVVGEMAALDGSTRSATVTACGDVDVRIVGQVAFMGFLHRWPDAGIALSGMISQRLRWANRRRVDFNGYPTSVRLPRILVELADEFGHRANEKIVFDVELTQDELGAMVGADVDTTGRELRKLKSRGVIDVGYRRIAINDLDALRVLAHLNA